MHTIILQKIRNSLDRTQIIDGGFEGHAVVFFQNCMS